MKTQQEIEAKIKEIEHNYRHVLTGGLASVGINAPRALQQLAAESKLDALYWTIGKTFKSKLKGGDR